MMEYPSTFCRETVAVTVDIQQMFQCFLVKKRRPSLLEIPVVPGQRLIQRHRLPHDDFGNSPSPAVDIYGLKQSVQKGEADYDADVRQFVEHDFYVDDGLK
jgi:hypothetical protein